MWKFSNVRESLIISTPPVAATPTLDALKGISLNCLETTASKTASLPLPPSIVVDRTLLILKSCGSTTTSLTVPVTTVCALAVVPVEITGSEISSCGGFRTS